MRWRWYKWLSRNRNNNECNYWSISPAALQKRERSMGHMLMSFPTEDLYRFSFLDISLTEIKGEFQEILCECQCGDTKVLWWSDGTWPGRQNWGHQSNVGWERNLDTKEER